MSREYPIYDLDVATVAECFRLHDECVRRLRERNAGRSYTFETPDRYRVGYAGQFGFQSWCEEIGATWKPRINPNGYSDDGVDVELLFDGRWREIDVKCRKDPRADEARFDCRKGYKARFYVIARLEGPLVLGRTCGVSIHGWISLPEVKRLPIKKVYGEDTYYEPLERLTGIDTWIPYCGQLPLSRSA